MEAFIVFSFLAGVMNALMDTIKHHWGRTWISGWLWKHWEAGYWWMNPDAWRHRKRQYWIFPAWMVWFLWDGWHAAKTLMMISLALAIYFCPGDIVAASIFIVTWGLAFNLFYHLLFLGGKHEKLQA